MKLKNLMKQTSIGPFTIGDEAANHIEGTEALVAVCGDDASDPENQANARFLAHCATQLPKLLAVLGDLLEVDDLVPLGEDGERNFQYECRWCGQEYDFGDSGIISRFCTYKGCLGPRIRAAVKDAEEVKES